jgi:hypothetical protein
MGKDFLDSLSRDKLQMFVTGLSGLAPEEIRKAKILYIRNSISEYKALKASYKAAGFVQVLFVLIPIFWPVLYLQRKTMRAEEKLFRERIENALEVWGDDLKGINFSIDEERA